MITLQLTDKEAIIVHMMYGLAAKIIAQDDPGHTVEYVQNVHECLSRNYSFKEKKAISAKITAMGNEVSLDTLRLLGVVNFNV